MFGNSRGGFLQMIPPVTKNLLIINVLMLAVMYLVPNFEGIMTRTLALHYWDSPDFNPAQLVTYMFLHGGFTHLFFNMLMLYYGGKIFLQYFSEKQLLLTYIFGGLFGALFFILAFNAFPVFEDMKGHAFALGSSASVLSILIAAATYRPDYTLNLFLLGQVKMKWVAIVFVVIDFLSITKGNSGGHIAHLGGALWGFLYAFMLKSDFDIYKIFKKKAKIRVKTVNSENYHRRPKTDEQYNAERAQEQEDVDRILEKIAKSGYSSLSDKEKEFLFRQSKK